MSLTTVLLAATLLSSGQAVDGLPDAARLERERQSATARSRLYTNESFRGELRPVRLAATGDFRSKAEVEEQSEGMREVSDPAEWTEADWRRMFGDAFDRVRRNGSSLASLERELANLNQQLRRANPQERARTRRKIQERTEVMAHARIALARANREVARLRWELQRVGAPLVWGR
jgi:chromosome segregation ATPase